MGKQEGIVENYLVEQAKNFGFLCPKFTSPGNNGYPDRLLIGHGMTIYVEVKQTNGSLQKLQEEIIKDLRRHGAIVYVAYTKEQIDNIFFELIV